MIFFQGKQKSNETKLLGTYVKIFLSMILLVTLEDVLRKQLLKCLMFLKNQQFGTIEKSTVRAQ